MGDVNDGAEAREVPGAEVVELAPGAARGRRGSMASRVAVTPVRIDVGGARRPPGVGLVPEVDPSPVGLRVALDWFTVLGRRPVSPERWEFLTRCAERRAVVTVRVEGSEVIPLECSKLGVDVLLRSEAGVRVLLRAPARCGAFEPRAVCAPGELTMAGAFERGEHAPGGPCGVRPLASLGERAAADRRGWRVPRGCEVPPGCLLAPGGWAFEGGAACVGAPGACRPELTEAADDGQTARDRGARRELYGAEVQIQGAAFSDVTRGGVALVARWWGALASWLYGDVIGGDYGWRFGLSWSDPFTVIGRVDVCADVAFPGDPGGSWVQWGVYAFGDHDGAFARFSTKARGRRSEETVPADRAAARAGDEWTAVSGRRVLLGKEVAGRTVYAGSAAYATLCVYERSKKRDGDWKVLEGTLRRAGWDGESEVIRAEARLSRAWMRDQVIRCPDGSPRYTATEVVGEGADARRFERARAADELTVTEWLDSVPTLAGEVFGRFRHTDPRQVCRVRDRDSSVWWRQVEGMAGAWAEGEGGAVGRIVSVRREASVGHTLARVRSGLARLVALRPGARDPRDVWGEVMEGWRDPHWRDARDAMMERTRARYLVEHPDAAEELEARAAAARARFRFVPPDPEELAAAPPPPPPCGCAGVGCWSCSWDGAAAIAG